MRHERLAVWTLAIQAAWGAVVASMVASPVVAEEPFAADPFADVGGVEAKPEAPSPPPAVAIPVRLPITGTRDHQIEAAIRGSLPRLSARAGQRGVLVLVFDASASDGGAGSDFGRSLELARFLVGRQLAGVKTVAYLPETVRGHAVLVALACEEIVMAPDAVLGPANADEPTVDETVRAGYVQIAGIRRSVPPAVALALVDPEARAVRAVTDDGEVFLPAEDLPELRKQRAVLDVEELQPAPIAPTGRRGRELGIVRLLAKSPAEVAKGLGLSPGSLAAGPAADGGWRATEVVVSGPIEPQAASRAIRSIERAVKEGSNFLLIRIDSAGGSPEQSVAMATAIAALDPAAVRTVAHVPREAKGDAALVATACDEIVMHPDAVLGGEGAAPIEGRQAEAIASAWKEGVARRKDRFWSLPIGLVQPGLSVHRAVRKGTGLVGFLCEEELESLEDRDAWQLGPAVGTGPIRLTGREAESLGLATHLVEDAAGVARAYGLEGPMKVFAPRWSDVLLDALASPGVAWLLLVIGGAGLYIELHTPGLGLGGFVSMVAFIVYFWGQHLHGTSGWLEVMLFLAGLVCVAAEIFVLPGFGVLGFGGGLLVIASIVLASQSFVLPSNDYQMRQLQWSLAGVLGVVASIAAIGLVARRWLPSTPMFRHMTLEPPSEDLSPAGFDEPPVGCEGVTTTRLAPLGKARFAGRLHDVASDGGLVEPGSRVRVVALRGGRVFVEELPSQGGA